MRYLDLGTVAAEESQAVYHALAELMTADQPVTLVTVSPKTPYVCVGYHQVASREVDRDYCETQRIPIGRRMVGGGAVWLDHDQIFWHLVMPRRHWSTNALYSYFLAAPVAAYRRMGIRAEHRPVNDIVVGPRKIGGTGAGSIGHADVLVGSLMMDFDVRAMARVLKVPSEKFRDKLVSSLEDYMTTVRRELGERAPTRETATRYLVEAFSELLQEPIIEDRLTAPERERLAYYRRYLFDSQFVYQSEGYVQAGIKIRDGVRLFEGVHKAPGGLVRVIWREADGVIDDLVVSGDFFVEPLDAMRVVREAVKGMPGDTRVIREQLSRLWPTFDMPGVSVDDIMNAMEHGQTLVVEA
ncbi:MAG: biotin/lipoate A/B protein ligase family protein [Firmicutes bacterium]|nr:biotin/lipoate A/B protein ligase family protein [Bacillota bacterium]